MYVSSEQLLTYLLSFLLMRQVRVCWR